MRKLILGVGFDDVTAQQAVNRAFTVIERREKAYIVTPNPEIVWVARRDEGVRNVLNGAELVLPDGIGVIMAAKILGTPLRERVPGIDFAALLFDKMSQHDKSVFLFGAKPGIAEEAAQKLAAAYPGLVVSGVMDGYTKNDDLTIERINSAKPDLLLVCLGAPRQELWIAANLDKLDVGLCVGLGGALDVYAGAVKRAPVFFRKLGLEWFYRLIREPRRIKRMIKLPLFILVVIFKRIRGSR